MLSTTKYGRPKRPKTLPPKKTVRETKFSVCPYEGKKHGRYYLTESGKKAYATPTSGGLFHVGIQVDPPNLE